MQLVCKRKPQSRFHLFGKIIELNEEIAIVEWVCQNQRKVEAVNIADLLFKDDTNPEITAFKMRFDIAKAMYFRNEISEGDIRQCHADWIEAARTKYPKFNRRFYQDM